MSKPKAFNPALVKRSPDDWEDSAIEFIENQGINNTLLIPAGVLGGLIVAAIAPIPLLGLVPVAIALKMGVDGNNQRSRMERAIEHGAIAAVLSEEDLKAYAREFGAEQAFLQIKWAKDSGIPISPAAEAILWRYRSKMKAIAAAEAAAAQTVEVESKPADEVAGDAGAIADESPQDDSGLFDWGDIQRHPDDFPHLLLLGKTGSGKTWLGEKLMRLLGGKALVIHPHAAPGDFPGFPVVGGGRDYATITRTVEALHSEMNLRYQRRDKGDQGYAPLTILIDEFPSIAHFCGKEVVAQILAIVREARKVKMRLIILSQGAEVKALGIEGQGSVRECFTFIRLKGFCEAHATKHDPAIASLLKQQRYPCLVEDMPADSSALASLPAPAPSPASPTPAVAIASPATEEPGDDFSAKETESSKAQQAVDRLKSKIIEKLKASKGDWISIRDLTVSLQAADRELAKQMIEKAIATGQLESESRQNPNRTQSAFVRVAPRK